MPDRSESTHPAVAHYRGELRRVLEGRRFVLFGEPVVGLAPLARELGAVGGEAFLLGSTRGTGPLPDRAVQPWVSLDVRARGLLDEFRRAERRALCPPRPVQRAIDRFDPERRARAAARFTMGHVPRAAGRRRFGGRPRRWMALEDKTRIEAWWQALAVLHAPSRVVRAEPAALLRAAAALDRGAGTVWAADARQGLHGGAAGTRWVGGPGDARRTARELARHCHRVRVMPFLPGVPCSIHGVVLPAHTVALRPVELVVLRRTGATELVYAGVGTTWDPPRRDREALRALARQVGEGLRSRLGYRGPFTIDGVLTADGFRPTELNARSGAAAPLFTAGLPEFPLAWLLLAAIEGVSLDWRAAWLEEVLVEASDRQRGGRGSILLRHALPPAGPIPLCAGARGLRRARRAAEATSSLVVGPSATGSYVRWAPHPSAIRAGERLAPQVARAFAWADRVLGAGIGAVEPLPET